MAITTYTDFLTNLGALDVAGVLQKFEQPPASVETADMPASFPRALISDDIPLTFDVSGGWPGLRGELVIVIEPVGQSTTPENHAACVGIIDGINSALRAKTATGHGLGRAPLNWNVRLTPQLIIGDRQVWAVIATVEGKG